MVYRERSGLVVHVVLCTRVKIASSSLIYTLITLVAYPLPCLLFLKLGLRQHYPVEILSELEQPHKFNWCYHKCGNDDVRNKEHSIVRQIDTAEGERVHNKIY